MKCNKCNFEMSDNEKFCPNCGYLTDNKKNDISDKEILDLSSPDIKKKYCVTFLSLLISEVIFGLLLPITQIVEFYKVSNNRLSYIIDNWFLGASFISIVGIIISVFVCLFVAFSKYKKDNYFKKLYIISAISIFTNVILLFTCSYVLFEYFYEGLFEWLKGCE